MSMPTQIQIRGTDEVRSWWRRACGAFDMEYGDFAVAVCKYVLENEAEFRKYLNTEVREDPARENR